MARATKKELRSFGLVVGIAFAILATAQWYFHGILDYRILYGISAFLILTGLTVPAILRPFNFVWMKLAIVLGWVMNRVILGVIFYIIFTFVATIMRIIKRDALDMKGGSRDSYWIERKDGPTPTERYERQF